MGVLPGNPAALSEAVARFLVSAELIAETASGLRAMRVDGRSAALQALDAKRLETVADLDRVHERYLGTARALQGYAAELDAAHRRAEGAARAAEHASVQRDTATDAVSLLQRRAEAFDEMLVPAGAIAATRDELWRARQRVHALEQAEAAARREIQAAQADMNAAAERAMRLIDMADVDDPFPVCLAIDPAITTAVERGAPAFVGASAAAVALWWGSLPEAERRRLIAENPRLIGNAEGVPYAVRDEANRRVLDAILADTWTRSEKREAAEAVAAALRDAADREVSAQLITLEFPSPLNPRAAIAYGDLDRATEIGLVIPGMDNAVANGMQDLGTAAYNLYDQQRSAGGTGGRATGPAVVAWMGYHTPGRPFDLSVLREQRAKDGAVHLVRALDGFNTLRGDEAEISVYAHSFATRTATYALSTGGSADRLVLVGSPGVAETVEDVSMLAVDEVYATLAGPDALARTGLRGSGNPDPTQVSFGAHVFSSDGSATGAPVDDHLMLLLERTGGEEHGYFDQGSDALRDMALIGLGRGDEIE